MKIINKYIIKEFFPQFFLGFLLFSFILLVEKLFDLMELIIINGASFLDVVKIFLYIFPSLFSFTFPMAFLIGTLLTLGQFHDNNEILAMRAGGISQSKIIRPLIILSILLSIFMIYFNQNVVPDCQTKLTNIFYNMVNKKPTFDFKEKTFFSIKNHKFYIEKIDKTNNTMENIIIYRMDNNSIYPITITAKKGTLFVTKNAINLNLFDGTIQQKDDQNLSKFSMLDFKEYLITFDMNEIKNNTTYSTSIANLKGYEIREKMKELKEKGISVIFFLIQYYERVCLGIACFVFALLGGSLTVSNTKHAKAVAFGLSLIVLVIYYILLTIGISLAEKKVLPVYLAINIPNICMSVFGFFLFLRVNRR